MHILKSSHPDTTGAVKGIFNAEYRNAATRFKCSVTLTRHIPLLRLLLFTNPHYIIATAITIVFVIIIVMIPGFFHFTQPPPTKQNYYLFWHILLYSARKRGRKIYKKREKIMFACLPGLKQLLVLRAFLMKNKACILALLYSFTWCSPVFLEGWLDRQTWEIIGENTNKNEWLSYQHTFFKREHGQSIRIK